MPARYVGSVTSAVPTRSRRPLGVGAGMLLLVFGAWALLRAVSE
jgi:hypothetical protein